MTNALESDIPDIADEVEIFTEAIPTLPDLEEAASVEIEEIEISGYRKYLKGGAVGIAKPVPGFPEQVELVFGGGLQMFVKIADTERASIWQYYGYEMRAALNRTLYEIGHRRAWRVYIRRTAIAASILIIAGKVGLFPAIWSGFKNTLL